jgi:hypothetical protein
VTPSIKLALRLAAPVVVLLAACGGNVVVDTGEGSGAATTLTTTGSLGGSPTGPGAGGSVGTGVSATGGAGGFNCFNLPSSSALSACSGSSSSGGMCDFSYCDTSSNDWEADCNSTACVCMLNGAELCTCALSSAGDICNGTPDCCFHH